MAAWALWAVLAAALALAAWVRARLRFGRSDSASMPRGCKTGWAASDPSIRSKYPGGPGAGPRGLPPLDRPAAKRQTPAMVPLDKLAQITQRFEFLEAQLNAGAAPAEIAGSAGNIPT
jgi:hypothetical protein